MYGYIQTDITTNNWTERPTGDSIIFKLCAILSKLNFKNIFHVFEEFQLFPTSRHIKTNIIETIWQKDVQTNILKDWPTYLQTNRHTNIHTDWGATNHMTFLKNNCVKIEICFCSFMDIWSGKFAVRQTFIQTDIQAQ